MKNYNPTEENYSNRGRIILQKLKYTEVKENYNIRINGWEDLREGYSREMDNLVCWTKLGW